MKFYVKFWGCCLPYLLLNLSCRSADPVNQTGEVRFMILNPGHFHAALVQKTMYHNVASDVHVFSEPGPELEDYLSRVAGYNRRESGPTAWNLLVYQGGDFLDKMLREKPGNVVVISGNNRYKAKYINGCIASGLNVLADKPMCIDRSGFTLLQEAFITAAGKGVLLYDIMTERYEITTILQRELATVPGIFGGWVTGTADSPAVTKESVHHFFKYVSGVPIRRPPWYFDESQQGEGIVDVTTHLVDLVQWECFPDEIIDYNEDIEMISARRWATRLDLEQFRKVTGFSRFPEYLQTKVDSSGIMPVYANGEMVYRLKGIHVKVSVQWNFEAGPGGGDTHFSMFRGYYCDLVIRQGPEQGFRPELYIEVTRPDKLPEITSALARELARLQEKYPGIGLVTENNGWRLEIPDRYRQGHEAHFEQVTEKYLGFLRARKLPEWEVPNMLAKYYTTVTAREMALRNMP